MIAVVTVEKCILFFFYKDVEGYFTGHKNELKAVCGIQLKHTTCDVDECVGSQCSREIFCLCLHLVYV